MQEKITLRTAFRRLFGLSVGLTAVPAALADGWTARPQRRPEVGDTVWLKSGSPPLQVRELLVSLTSGLPNARCDWRATDGTQQSLTLPEDCFTLTPAPLMRGPAQL